MGRLLNTIVCTVHICHRRFFQRVLCRCNPSSAFQMDITNPLVAVTNVLVISAMLCGFLGSCLAGVSCGSMMHHPLFYAVAQQTTYGLFLHPLMPRARGWGGGGGFPNGLPSMCTRACLVHLADAGRGMGVGSQSLAFHDHLVMAFPFVCACPSLWVNESVNGSCKDTATFHSGKMGSSSGHHKNLHTSA